MRPTVTAWVAITFEDGSLGRMQFFAEPTPENVQAAIEKTLWASSPVSWRQVKQTDFPSNEVDRAAWRDDGKTIAVDQAVKARLGGI